MLLALCLGVVAATATSIDCSMILERRTCKDSGHCKWDNDTDECYSGRRKDQDEPQDMYSTGPTFVPSFAPTSSPRDMMYSSGPTRVPTFAPTNHPRDMMYSSVPTFVPSFTPTSSPRDSMPVMPSQPFQGSGVPTMVPTFHPTMLPTTFQGSGIPSMVPTFHPTMLPTTEPRDMDTVSPTFLPSFNPTATPTYKPTGSQARPARTPRPTVTRGRTPQPTNMPTPDPTESKVSMSNPPTLVPTRMPTFQPTKIPGVPTIRPTMSPTVRHPPTPLPTQGKSFCLFKKNKRACEKDTSCLWNKKTRGCVGADDFDSCKTILKRSKCKGGCAWSKILGRCEKPSAGCGHAKSKIKLRRPATVWTGTIEGGACECESFCDSVEKAAHWVLESKKNKCSCYESKTFMMESVNAKKKVKFVVSESLHIEN